MALMLAANVTLRRTIRKYNAEYILIVQCTVQYSNIVGYWPED